VSSVAIVAVVKSLIVSRRARRARCAPRMAITAWPSVGFGSD
jgi:hypothetical protein